jgi:DNA-binding MarR family transcriptional regulator
MATDRTRADETAELADALFNLMPMVVNHVNHRLDQLGMTNTDYWALRSIQGPMPMKDLAHCMDFDPSYVTLVADHLENLGLIERQQHPTDRRIKNLVLTAKGRRLKKSIPGMLWDGPNTFSALTDGERRRLVELLAKLAASNPSDNPASGATH